MNVRWMKKYLFAFLLLLGVSLAASGCTKRPYDPAKNPKEKEPEKGNEENVVTAPPADLLQWLDGKSSPLSPWYKKYISDEGFPILASAVVRDEALIQCRYIVHTMLSKHPEARTQMIKLHWRVAICGYRQNITDIPECAMMKIWWPDTDWDARGRGYGATEALPVMSIGEENIVKIPDFTERYATESIMVHEFAHNVDYALRKCWAGFEKRLLECYNHAKKSGLWQGGVYDYAMTNSEEYFAEASQAWYNTCRMIVRDPDTGKNFTLKTREQLKEHDPQMYDLLSTVYTEDFLTGYHFDYE
jgi:hypothetical protein